MMKYCAQCRSGRFPGLCARCTWLKHKTAARWQVQYAIRRGRLERGPCEVGLDCFGPIEAHHDDYDKPLEIRWLCQHHHQIEDAWKLAVGVEPTTAGLRNQSSATELRQHPKASLDRQKGSVSADFSSAFEPTTASDNQSAGNATYIEETTPGPGEIPPSGMSTTAESPPETVPEPSVPPVARESGPG